MALSWQQGTTTANRGCFISDERRSQIPRARSTAAAPWSRRSLRPWPRTLALFPREPPAPACGIDAKGSGGLHWRQRRS